MRPRTGQSESFLHVIIVRCGRELESQLQIAAGGNVGGLRRGPHGGKRTICGASGDRVAGLDGGVDEVSDEIQLVRSPGKRQRGIHHDGGVHPDLIRLPACHMKSDLAPFPPMTSTLGMFVTGDEVVAGNQRKISQRVARINSQERNEIGPRHRKRDEAIRRNIPGSPRRLPAGDSFKIRLAGFKRRVCKRAG